MSLPPSSSNNTASPSHVQYYSPPEPQPQQTDTPQEGSIQIAGRNGNRIKRMAIGFRSDSVNAETRANQKSIVIELNTRLESRKICVDSPLGVNSITSEFGEKSELSALAGKLEWVNENSSAEKAKVLEEMEAELMRLAKDSPENQTYEKFLEIVRLEMQIIPSGGNLSSESVEGIKLAESILQEVDDVDVKTSYKLSEPCLRLLNDSFVDSVLSPDMVEKFDVAISKYVEDTSQDEVKHLSDILSKEINKLTKASQLSFVISQGETFKSELFDCFCSKIRTAKVFNGAYENADKRVKDFMDQVYTKAVSGLEMWHVSDKTITLDGVNYANVKVLAEGGFGMVSLYEAQVDGHTHQIAVKTPKSRPNVTPQKIFEEFSGEARVHWTASQGSHSNVISFIGAVQNSEGGLILVTEYAPYGDLGQLSKKVKKCEQQGVISPLSASLVRSVLLLDMLQGLQHIQEVHGITHMDIKPMNYFLGSGGKAKLGDFGLADTSLNREFAENPVENPRYQPPEQLEGGLETEKSIKDKDKLDAHKAKLINKLIKNAADLSPADRDEMLLDAAKYLSKLDEFILGQEKVTFQVSEKADIWSLGVAAYEVFFGQRPFESEHIMDIEEQIIEFSSNPDNTILPESSEEHPPSDLVSKLRMQAANVINMAMQPDPEKRARLSGLQRRSLFVELPADTTLSLIRDVIIAVAQHDISNDAISNASSALDNQIKRDSNPDGEQGNTNA